MRRCISCGNFGQGIICHRCSKKAGHLVDVVKKDGSKYAGIIALTAISSIVGYKAFQFLKKRK